MFRTTQGSVPVQDEAARPDTGRAVLRGHRNRVRSVRRLALGALATVMAVPIAGCVAPVPAPQQPTGVPVAVADWGDLEDEMTPLIIEALAPDPIAVRGSDEQFHAAYELTVLNFSPKPAVITGVRVLDADGGVVAVLSQQEVADRTMLVADYSTPEVTAAGRLAPAQIASGKTALLVLEVTADTRAGVPQEFSHEITAQFGTAESGAGGIAELWPDSVTQIGGSVRVSDERPVVIGPPLTGSDWLVSAACCTLNVHRNVMLPVGGRINGGERYAIDVSQVDLESVRQRGFTPESVVHGDPAVNTDYLAYGASVLAVADGTVVSVMRTVADTDAGSLPIGPGFTLANLGGNVVVIELDDGLFAVYYHLAPESPTVEVGDRVMRGQEIALLGNSGNSSAAHLHFQISRTPLIFSSDSVPYEIDSFTLLGEVDEFTAQFVGVNGSGARTEALPQALNVVDFGNPPSS